MPAFRSVVSVLLRELGDFLYTLRPALRAAACGGRPRAGNDTTGTGDRPHPAPPTSDDHTGRSRLCSSAERTDYHSAMSFFEPPPSLSLAEAASRGDGS
jgi:hypothetical protein